MAKYLDQTGLAHYDGNIKQQLVRSFDTVAQMQAATDLAAGMTCHTNGYTTASDGMGAFYTIAASGDIACANSLYATEVGTTSGVLLLGDSYGEGYTPEGIVTSWIPIFTEKAQQYGYTVYSTYMGGAGFYSSDNTKKFTSVLSNYVSTLTDTQKKSIRTVIIGGGYNDRGVARDNIYNGMVGVRDVINDNLPNVDKVLVFPFGMAVQGLTTGAHSNFTYSSIVGMINNYIDANAQAKLGTIVGRANMCLRRNGYFSSDYVHPNSNGQYVIAGFVFDTFLGNASSYFPDSYALEYPNNFEASSAASSVSLDLKTTQNADGFIINVQTSNINFSTPIDVTFNGGNPITIGSFKDAALQRYGIWYVTCIATLHSTTSSPRAYSTVIGRLDCVFGELRFHAKQVNSAGNNFETISSVDSIDLWPIGRPYVSGLTLR